MAINAKFDNESLVDCTSSGALIGANGRVYPCCYVHAEIEGFGINENPINKYFVEDKDWNNAYKKSVTEICQHEAFTKHFNLPDFCNKDAINPICLINCKK